MKKKVKLENSEVNTDGKIKMGICSWGDKDIQKFYPPTCKTSEDKLRFYSSKFPCTEVDTSNYAIPSATQTEKWVQRTPPDFKFHFKAFQMFTFKQCETSALPGLFRQTLSESQRNSDKTFWGELTTEQQDLLWDHFNKSLAPVYSAGKLGVVLFQFPQNFQPIPDNFDFILYCREMLQSDYKMCIEFRDLSWLKGESMATILELCTEHNIVLCCVDEVRSEAKSKGHVTPIEITSKDCLYIRVHRRYGSHRLLFNEEIEEWSQRLLKIYEQMEGTIYFMWNTNYEDQSAQNAAALSRLLPEKYVFDWKSKMESKPGQLLYFFNKKPKEESKKEEEEEEKKEVVVKKEAVDEAVKIEPKKRVNETSSKSSPKKQKRANDIKNVKPLTSYFCK